MEGFTHLDTKGKVKMVDVGHKKKQFRIALAEGTIELQKETITRIKSDNIVKGNVLTIAKTAGIQAAKQTFNLIPLCHNIFLSQVEINFDLSDNAIKCLAEAKAIDVTGVEMEALMAVSTALLTIYDMCKAIDKTMVIKQIKLNKKEKFDV